MLYQIEQSYVNVFNTGPVYLWLGVMSLVGALIFSADHIVGLRRLKKQGCSLTIGWGEFVLGIGLLLLVGICYLIFRGYLPLSRAESYDFFDRLVTSPFSITTIGTFSGVLLVLCSICEYRG
ncbi:MAG: hypothetical protein U0M15_09170 [Bacillota bacterium]|nr:hypothetical protein [Bacillota bacterium]